MEVLFLTYGSVLTQPVLQSQVLTFIRSCPPGVRFTLVSCEWFPVYRARRTEIERLRQDLAASQVRLWLLPKILPPRNQRTWQFGLDLLFLTLVTFWLLLRYRLRVVHARGYEPALVCSVVAPLFGARWMFDARGVLPEELAESKALPDTSMLFRVWKSIEGWLLRRAPAVSVVSHVFSRHFRALGRRGKVVVVPCCVDAHMFRFDLAARQQLRTQEGWTDRLVVVYSGSTNWYQEFGTCIQVFKHLSHLSPNALLLALVNDRPAEVEKTLGDSLPSGSFVVKSLVRAEVPRYLCAADVALLLRSRSLVSQVACPVKFAEYLACGVPVVATPGIGDVSEIIRAQGLGVLLEGDWESCLRLLQQQLQDPTLKARCREYATRELTWSAHATTWLNEYARLAGEPPDETDTGAMPECD